MASRILVALMVTTVSVADSFVAPSTEGVKSGEETFVLAFPVRNAYGVHAIPSIRFGAR